MTAAVCWVQLDHCNRVGCRDGGAKVATSTLSVRLAFLPSSCHKSQAVSEGAINRTVDKVEARRVDLIKFSWLIQDSQEYWKT